MTRPPDDSATDVSLILRVGRSPTDQAAWARFVDRYGARILGWSRGWGLQQADAEDVAQAVLVKLARQMGRFAYDPSRSFRSWLRHLARNAWRDWAAQREPHAAVGGDADQAIRSIPACEDLVQRLEANFDLEILEMAMHQVRDRVAPRTWDAYLLVTRDGLATTAVAERLGLSVASVFKARSNVLKMLREEIRSLERSEIDAGASP